MHTTKTGQSIQSLKREAADFRRKSKIVGKADGLLPGAKEEARQYQEWAENNLTLADKLRSKARLEDLSLWVMVKTRMSTRNGLTKHEYWMASWREGAKVHNEYLGSCKKVTADQALMKAHKIKAEALGLQVEREDSNEDLGIT